MKKPTAIIKPIDKEEKLKKFQEACAKRFISVVDPEKEVGYECQQLAIVGQCR